MMLANSNSTSLIRTIKGQPLRQVLMMMLLCLAFFARGQEIKVSGHFSKDSLQLGVPVPFALSAHYPEKLNILFPDSSFSFAPFELHRKDFFSTKTKDGISRDSVIYWLTSFEIDSTQSLSLPVFVVSEMDCTQVLSNADTIFFKGLVKSIPDSIAMEKLPLKANTNYVGVPWQLNYFVVAMVGGGVLVILAVSWILFGQRIKTHFKLKRLTKAYEAFRIKFEDAVDKLDKDFSPRRAETSLVIWKNYLESLLAKPYTKYTSKEIKLIEKSEELGVALSEIDRMIYGHRSGNVHAPFADLKTYVRAQFEKKKAEVIRG